MLKRLSKGVLRKLTVMASALLSVLSLEVIGAESGWDRIVTQDLGSGWSKIEAYAYDAGGGWQWLPEAGIWVLIFDLNEEAVPGGELAAALGQSTWDVTTGGAMGWKVSGGAVRSGEITHSQVSELTAQVLGPGLLRFNWKVSSELDYDVLEFWVNGELLAEISGEKDWQEEEFLLEPGNYQLKWVYRKDRTASAGLDAGWIADVWLQALAPYLYLGGNLEFGGVAIGNSATRELELSNIGTAQLVVSEIIVPQGFGIDWTGGTIAPESVQRVTVSFAPQELKDYRGKLEVLSNATEGTNFVEINGRGQAANRAIVLSGDLWFGAVLLGQTATRTLTIQNTGDSTLTVSGITYPSGFSGNWSSGTIAAGGSRSVTVTFAPLEEQYYSGTLAVSSNATEGTNFVEISGRGVAVVPSVMVLVQGGTLPASSSLGAVTVSTFYIGRTEVTWGEWLAVRTWAAANGYDIGSVGAGCAYDHPVHTVNWYDVVKWSNAKSEQEGLTPVYTVSGAVYRSGQINDVVVNASANGYRLPTEAEWEFAARGGNQTNGYTYAGSNDLNAVGWYRDNSGGAACNLSSGLGTWPVGQKAANELGLYDMSGNVWEWCWDRLSPNSSFRHVRGGSWVDSAGGCTVSDRGVSDPDLRGNYDGFRLARSSGN